MKYIDVIMLGLFAIATLTMLIGCSGNDGAQGAPGQQGLPGVNGSTGPQGAPGQDSILVYIEPCGAGSSSYKEVLLGLSGGQVYSEFSGSSDGTTVRNTLLPDGSFQDTDDSHCPFNVSTDAAGDRLVSWSSGSATYTAATAAWTTQQ